MSQLQSLSPSQIELLRLKAWRSAKLRDLHDVITIIANTGLRAGGELQNLQWVDVDLGNKRMYIAGTKSSTRRIVPLSSKTLSVMASRLAHSPESKFVLGNSPSGLLKRVSGQLSQLGESVGSSGLTLGVLRHSFFILLVTKGADVATVCAIGGWRKPSFLKQVVPATSKYLADQQAKVEESDSEEGRSQCS